MVGKKKQPSMSVYFCRDKGMVVRYDAPLGGDTLLRHDADVWFRREPGQNFFFCHKNRYGDRPIVGLSSDEVVLLMTQLYNHLAWGGKIPSILT
jgi:hypothetical protein